MPCLQHRNTLRRLTRCTRSHASSVVSSTEPSSFGEMPALLKSTSMRPSSRRTASHRLLHLQLVGDIRLQGQVARRAGQQVDAGDVRALALEALDGRRADPAARAGDDAHLPLEPPCSRHPAVA